MEQKNEKWTLNDIDWQKIKRNTLLFVAPVAVIYLGAVVDVINKNGLSLDAFVPSSFVMGAIALYVINVLLDWFRKLSAGE